MGAVGSTRSPEYELRVVAEDLEYVRDSCEDGDISNAGIRRTSATLRGLLVERGYAKAWRLAGLRNSR